MARAGDELFNPAIGLRTVFRETAQTTGGELLQVDWIGRPGWSTGPDHVHPGKRSASKSSPAVWVCGLPGRNGATAPATRS